MCIRCHFQRKKRALYETAFNSHLNFWSFALRCFAIACSVNFFLPPRRFANILPFITLEECGQDRACFLVHTGNHFVGDMFVVTPDACDPWRTMYFREKVAMPQLSEHGNVLNVFHDVNSTLYTLTIIEHKAGFLLKAINVFHSVSLFMKMARKIMMSCVWCNKTLLWGLKTTWWSQRIEYSENDIFMRIAKAIWVMSTIWFKSVILVIPVIQVIPITWVKSVIPVISVMR